MIARLWYGKTAEAKGDAYLEILRETGVKAFRGTAGNRGAYVFRRLVDGKAEFLVMSLWSDFDAIRRFAGPEPETAVYYPADDAYLLDRTPGVDHYEVLIDE